MAKVWAKSLQCKSTALDDVYTPRPLNSKKALLSCGNSSQALRDVVFLLPKHPHLPKKPPPIPAPPPQTRPESAKKHRTAKPKHKPKKPESITSPFPSPSPSHAAGPTSIPTLTELPEGHSSRRVVEIIFGSSWSTGARFPGRIEMLFRVHNPTRNVARFEEYRSAVRSLSAAADSRCAVDGNEMMRFHCPSAAADGIYDAAVFASPAGIRTFAGSGGAHESAGGGPGRRSMLVCRVVAGRMRKGRESDPDTGESVSGPGKGELVVFDARAVLPCFLIIYKV